MRFSSRKVTVSMMDQKAIKHAMNSRKRMFAKV